MHIVVVGGGLVGLSSAYVLAERGHEVMLLESREAVAQETSFANGGMLTASMSDPWNGPGVGRHLLSSLFGSGSAMKLHLHAVPSLMTWGLQFLKNSTPTRHRYACEANYHLARYSIEQTGRLREKLQLDYDASTQGTIKLFRDEQALQSSLQVAQHLEALGLNYSRLNTEQTLAVEPALSPIRNEIVGALHFPGDESGNAYQFCQALLAAFRNAGGRVEFARRVERLVMNNHSASVLTGEGRAYQADAIVIAAGNGSVPLLTPIGIRLAIAPAKGYSVTMAADDLSGRPKIPVIDDALHAAVVPLGSQLRLVGTAEFDGFNPAINPRRIDNLYALLRAVYPELYAQADRKSALNWAGFRPMSADGRPFIGPSAVKGLCINTGHGHLGWTKAVGSACLLADQIENRPPAISIEPFRIHR